MRQSSLPSESEELWGMIDWLSDPYSDDDESTPNLLDEGYMQEWDEDTE